MARLIRIISYTCLNRHLNQDSLEANPAQPRDSALLRTRPINLLMKSRPVYVQAAVFSILLFLGSLSSPLQAQGTIRYATSCNAPDVQATINQAQDEDTIQLPECPASANISWSSINGTNCNCSAGDFGACMAVYSGLNPSTYRISNPKGIKINGAGIDRTYITDLTECAGTMGSGTGYCAYDTVPMSCGGAAPLFLVYLQSGQTFEISNLTITTPRNDPGGIIALKGAGIFKLHDVKFKDYRGRLLVLQTNSFANYVYSNHFIGSPGVTVGQMFDVIGNNDSDWGSPNNFGQGSSSIAFIEGNTFDIAGSTDGGDCQNGGRLVFRYNTVNGDVCIGNHGADSVPRSCMQMEIYNNIFSNSYGSADTWRVQFRGGSGVVFNNQFSGASLADIGLTNYRSVSGFLWWGGEACDGSSGYDGNTSPTTTYHGWPCRDQIGRGADGGTATSPQSSFPLYLWNNFRNGNPVNASVYSVYGANGWFGNDYTFAHIVEGRDYFDNQTKSGYSPYICPHPAAGLNGSCDSSVFGTVGYNITTHDTTAPAAPTGVTVK